MDAYCQFHPLTKSKWQCPKCGIAFCSRCVKQSERSPEQCFCAECGERMEEQVSSAKVAQIRPWHQTFTLFFNATLKLWTIKLLLVSFVISFALLEFVGNASLYVSVGVVLSLNVLIGLGLSKAVALTNTELRSLPSFSNVFKNAHSKNVLFLCAQIMVLVTAVAVLQLNGFTSLSVLFSLIVFSVMPLWVVRSMLFSAASSSARRRTADFERVPTMEVLSILKEKYVELLLIIYGSVLTVALANSVASTFLTLPAAMAITASFTLLACLISGLAMGLVARYVYLSKVQVKRKSVVSHELPKFDDTLNLSLKTGRYSLALDQLEKSVVQATSGYRLEQFYRLLTFTKNWNAIERYSHRILDYLLVRDKVPECISLLHSLKDRKSGFAIWDAKLCLRLAESFEKREAHSMLLWLSIDAHKRFPNEPGVVSKIYFMVAHILEHQGQGNEKVAAFRRFAFQLQNEAEKQPPVVDPQLGDKPVINPRLV